MDSFAKKLLCWYDRAGRKDLPWQHPRDPYRVWLSEIMLQQTQVNTVIPYFENFLQNFPTLADLANAELDQVLGCWSGLGYYARARNLHAASKVVRDLYQGEFPSSQEELEKLPGIGRSTAGAIRAQAFAQPGVILDANVRRVLCRYHAIDQPVTMAETQDRLWALAKKHTPGSRHADYAQAIMDLGATLCGRRPKCEICPLQPNCLAFKQDRQTELPIKIAAIRAKPVRRARMLILKNADGKIYLERRPPVGIWGGMLCPPMEYLNDDGANVSVGMAAAELPLRRHSFSHFHLDFIPVVTNWNDQTGRILETEAGLWYNLGSAAPGGIPAPVSKIFEELLESQYA